MSTMQGALFDLEHPTAPAAPAAPVDGVDWARLDELAFLYTATEKGTSTGIRFGASVADAQAWCSTRVSTGQAHGTRWAYMWTTATNYIRHHCGDAAVYGARKPRIDMSGCRDDGTWDDRIAAAGVTKIDLRDLAALLRSYGVEVITR